MQRILLSGSFLTLLAAGWLVVMEMVLQHPGFVTRIAMTSCIVGISVATILTQGFHAGIRAERWLCAAAGIVLIGFGIQAFLRDASAAHFEGYVVVVASLIVLQGLLLLISLQRRIGRDYWDWTRQSRASR